MNSIKIKNLNFSFLDGVVRRKILNNVNIEIEKGKVTVIYGPSGSGKTTLLYALSGMLDNIDLGEVFVDGISIYEMNQYKRDNFRLNHMGLVFQNFNLFPYMDVMENIFISIYSKGIKPTVEDKENANKLLRLLDLEDCIHKSINSLSGGEQQRIAIIRAFINRPSIILCDEPTANLDRQNSIIFYEKIKSLAHEEHCTVVVVSHDEIAREHCDYAIEIVDGAVK